MLVAEIKLWGELVGAVAWDADTNQYLQRPARIVGRLPTRPIWQPAHQQVVGAAGTSTRQHESH